MTSITDVQVQKSFLCRQESTVASVEFLLATCGLGAQFENLK